MKNPFNSIVAFIIFSLLSSTILAAPDTPAAPGAKSDPSDGKTLPFSLNLPNLQEGKIKDIGQDSTLVNSKSIISLKSENINQSEEGFFGIKVFLVQKDRTDSQRLRFLSSWDKSIKIFDDTATPSKDDLRKNWYVDAGAVGDGNFFTKDENIPIMFYFQEDKTKVDPVVFRVDLSKIILADSSKPYTSQEGDKIQIEFYEFFLKNSAVEQDNPKPLQKDYAKKSDWLAALYKAGYFSIVPQPAKVLTMNVIDYGLKLSVAPMLLFATKFTDSTDVVSKNLNPTAKAPGVSTALLYEFLDGGNDFGNYLLNNVAPTICIGAVSSGDGTFQFTPGISMPAPVLNWIPFPESVLKLMRENFRISLGMQNFKDPVFGFTITLGALNILKPSDPGGTTKQGGDTAPAK